MGITRQSYILQTMKWHESYSVNGMHNHHIQEFDMAWWSIRYHEWLRSNSRYVD